MYDQYTLLCWYQKLLIRLYFLRVRLHIVDQYINKHLLCIWKAHDNEHMFSSNLVILYLVLHRSVSCCKVSYIWKFFFLSDLSFTMPNVKTFKSSLIWQSLTEFHCMTTDGNIIFHQFFYEEVCTIWYWVINSYCTNSRTCLMLFDSYYQDHLFWYSIICVILGTKWEKIFSYTACAGK
jgi:hypothetical protein